MGVEVICGFPTTMSATNFDDFFVGSAVACHNMGKSIESKCSFRFLRDHDSAAAVLLVNVLILFTMFPLIACEGSIMMDGCPSSLTTIIRHTKDSSVVG